MTPEEFTSMLLSKGIDLDGVTIPSFEDLEIFEFDAGATELPAYLKVHGNPTGNLIACPRERACPHPIEIHYYGEARGTMLLIGARSEVYGQIHLHQEESVVVVGEDIDQWSLVNMRMWSRRQKLVWGKGSTSNGVDVVIQGDDAAVVVEDDCMFANNITIRNSDMHPIVDVYTGRWLNPPANVRIKKHVWVGQDALLLKGVTVGPGSIVGAKSLVNKNVPPISLVAGVPAKLVRAGVTWDRPEFPRLEHVRELAESFSPSFNL